MTQEPKRRYDKLATRLHAADPTLTVFWNVTELVRQAGLHGVPLTQPWVITLLRRGQGPKIIGIAGSAVLIRPADGLRWIEDYRTGRNQLTKMQQALDFKQDEFASL